MSEALNPRVRTVTLTSANTEYSLAFGGALHWSMQCRTSADVRFAFATGLVSAPTGDYATMKSRSCFSSPEKLSSDSQTIYLASGSAGVVVEFTEWD